MTTANGTKDTGLEAHVRGWTCGAIVEMFYDNEKEKDNVQVKLSSGSSGKGTHETNNSITLFTLSEDEVNQIIKGEKKVGDKNKIRNRNEFNN